MAAAVFADLFIIPLNASIAYWKLVGGTEVVCANVVLFCFAFVFVIVLFGLFLVILIVCVIFRGIVVCIFKRLK